MSWRRALETRAGQQPLSRGGALPRPVEFRVTRIWNAVSGPSWSARIEVGSRRLSLDQTRPGRQRELGVSAKHMSDRGLRIIVWGDGKHGDGTEPAGHNNTVFPAPAAVNGKACRPAARPLTAVVAGKSCQYDRQEESR